MMGEGLRGGKSNVEAWAEGGNVFVQEGDADIPVEAIRDVLMDRL